MKLLLALLCPPAAMVLAGAPLPAVMALAGIVWIGSHSLPMAALVYALLALPALLIVHHAEAARRHHEQLEALAALHGQRLPPPPRDVLQARLALAAMLLLAAVLAWRILM